MTDWKVSAQNAVKALQGWYPNGKVGLYDWEADDYAVSNELGIPNDNDWVIGGLKVAAPDLLAQIRDTLRWWNSANAITALIDYMLVTNDQSYIGVVDNTFTKAPSAWRPKRGTDVRKIASDLATGHTGDWIAFNTNFLNDFYDDEGWWALAWIKAYDLTRDQKYLKMAVTIAQDMTTGWDTTFGGGIYWGKDHSGPTGSPYKNAIANELFMAVAARLYLRTQDTTWKTWAKKEYDWFINSGLIWGSVPGQDLNHQRKYLINDSLNPSSGKNDGTQTLWTYNHGVILGALCDIWVMFGDQLRAFPLAGNPLALANAIADAAIKQFAPNGILTEPACDPNCSVDGCQFKGVFIRNLATLFAYDHKSTYSELIKQNAATLVANNPTSQFGSIWSANSPDGVDFVRQTAAIDALNAGNRVVIAEAPISLKNALARVGQFPPTGIRGTIAWLTPSVRAWLAAWET